MRNTRRTAPRLRILFFMALSFVVVQAIHAENLVPTTPCTAPNYACTWAAQNYMEGQGVTNFNCSSVEGGTGNAIAQTWIRDTTVFGPRGWSKRFHPKARADLYFLLDDGEFCDNRNTTPGCDGSFKLDLVKFPSFAGGTNQDQWKRVNDSIKANGWRSLALWCRNPNGTNYLPIEWCKYAGVDYWKIDGGDEGFEQEAMRATRFPSLKMEHMPNYSECLNGDWSGSGRFDAQGWGNGTFSIMQKADIVRTYDVTPALSVATTIDRACQLLKIAGGQTNVTCLLNVEDEPYIAAGLGCLMGIMRQPMAGLRSPDCDLFFAGPRLVKKRMDEVARALRWHRIAPPYASGLYTTVLDAAILTDSWKFSTGETWYSQAINNGNPVYQGAPARAARGLALPMVTGTTTSQDSLPFVLASKYPSGATSIATIGRCKTANGWFSPRADVSVEAGAFSASVGILGFYRNLTINYTQQLPADAKVMVQDLIDSVATDITSQITKPTATSIKIPGSLITQYGLKAATPGDVSDPGMVLVIRSATATSSSALRSSFVKRQLRLAVLGQIVSSTTSRLYGSTGYNLIDIQGRKISAQTRRTADALVNGVYLLAPR